MCEVVVYWCVESSVFMYECIEGVVCKSEEVVYICMNM